MSEHSSIGSEQAVATDSDIARSIRFAVYLTGGLVTLAFGVSQFAGALGQIVNCALQNISCPGGFSNGFLAEEWSVLGASVFLVAVAIVLFALARRER